MVKVAIPVKDDWLSSSFSGCAYFLIYEIEERKVVGKKVDIFPDEFIEKMITGMSKDKITAVIANGIEKEILAGIANTKINLFVGVNISYPDLLIEEFLNGTLRSNTKNIIELC